MSTLLSIELTDDEVKYICSLIPKAYAISYFQHNEKRFHKLKPGFRAVGLNQLQVDSILMLGIMKRDTFIVDFLENHLKKWLRDISESIDKYKQEGELDVAAKLLTLSESFFVENPAIYFKITQEIHSEDYILVFSDVLNLIKKSREKVRTLEIERDKSLVMRNEQSSKNKMMDQRLSYLNSELIDARSKDKANVQRLNHEIESKEQELVKIQANLTKANSVILLLEKEIKLLQSHSRDLQASVESITIERDSFKADYDYLYNEIGIADAHKEVAATKDSEEDTQFSVPKRPTAIKEFAEFLEYNLENFGMKAGRQLLVHHLCKVLFEGVPLLVDKTYSNNLIYCVTNTLLNGQGGKTLQYRTDITVQEMEMFLNESGRIVCFDGFIGNYNEMLLIPIFQKYKDKIIFLTISYDETLKYVSEGFLCYARYININHFVGLKQYPIHKEDPSEFEESEFAQKDAIYSERFGAILSTIMNELGFSAKYIHMRSSEVDSEDALIELLAFEILPYINDVLRKNPFMISEKLLKFTRSDRFKYKSLFKEWFNL